MSAKIMQDDLTGRFVFSRAGHDKGQLYVVTAQEKDIACLCDGRLKTVASPKKKKLKHIQPTLEKVDEEMLERLLAGTPVRDEEIKYQIRRYKETKRNKENQ